MPRPDFARFFREYANVSLSLRNGPLSFKEGGNTTLHDCYINLQRIQDEIWKKQDEANKFIDLAEILLGHLNKRKV